MTHLLCSGLKYLIPQQWEFSSYTDAKNKEINLLNTQSPAEVRGSHCCTSPAPCQLLLEDHKTHISQYFPAETPQSHFCPDRHKTPAGAETVGYKTKVPSIISPAFALLPAP